MITKPPISLDQHARTPLYKQLYARLRDAILAGQLGPGNRLPSTRALASELGISRTTTALAYEHLLLEGYIESRVGAGTHVVQLQTGQRVRVADDAGNERTAARGRPPEPMLSRRGRLLASTQFPEAFYANEANAGANLFRVGQPDVASFRFETWTRLVAKHARRSLQACSYYQDTRGCAPLRAAIAAHIGVTRGVQCSPEQILLTAGAQGALDLVARVLLDPGDSTWVEDPGYGGARGALLAAGAKPVAVPVDGEGLDIEAGCKRCPDARLAIVTPSHQFPTGVTMSLRRRLALLQWVRDADAWVVEDDYDSEFRFSGRPLEALQGLDPAARVIYVGTFSKVLFPSLRLGYLVAPAALIDGLLAARRFIDMHPPLLEQLALADFIAGGHFTRHLRTMRTRYRERRDALVDALRGELGDLLDVAAPEAGMHLVAWLPAGVDGHAAARAAAAHGLHILSVSDFSVGPLPRDGLVLAFAGNAPHALRAGVQRLARALHGMP